MFRNDDPTAIASLPATPAPTGSTPGYFTDGNPGAGLPATIVPDWWATQIQEELMAFVTAASLTPTKGNNAQVKQACSILFGNTVNLALQGWQRTAGGIIVQWGSGVTTSGNQDTVYFPLTFPNAIYAITVTEGNAVGWSNPPTPSVYGSTRLGAGALTGFLVSGATINRSGVPAFSGSLGYNYIAVGY